MRIYLDAAPIIYTVETVPVLSDLVDARLALPTSVRVTSEIARLECRVKPLKDANVALLEDFDDFFARNIAEIVPITREVIDRATEIRARYGFKTSDAIHLAAAVVAHCEVFYTNDYRLDRFPDLTIEVVQA